MDSNPIIEFFRKRGPVNGIDVAKAFDRCDDYEKKDSDGRVITRKGHFNPFAGHLSEDHTAGSSYFLASDKLDLEGANVTVFSYTKPEDDKSFGVLMLEVTIREDLDTGFGRYSFAFADTDATAVVRRSPNGDFQLYGKSDKWHVFTRKADVFHVVLKHIPEFGWMVASCCPGHVMNTFSHYFPSAEGGDVFLVGGLSAEMRDQVIIETPETTETDV